MKKVFFLLAFSLISLVSVAQMKQEMRREFDKYNASGDVILTGKEGFMMVYRDTVIKGIETWKIRQFDTELKDKETIEFKSEKELSGSLEYFNEEQNIYYKLDYKGYAKARAFKLFTFAAGASRVEMKEGVLPEKFAPSSMKNVGQGLFITGYVKKAQIIVCMNVKTGKCTLLNLPGVDQKPVIAQVEPYEKEKICAVTISFGKKADARILQVCTFKDDGTKFREPIQVKNTTEKYIVSASVTWLEDGEFMVAGAYSKDKNPTANGIYVASFSGAQQKYFKYYSFSDLKNFNEYLSEKRKEKVEKAIEKKKSKGKEDIIETFVKTHKIQKYNDQYILIGEVYYPTYRTETRTSYSNGQTVTTTYTVFDGYQYTHATVIGLDAEGNKVWDNCFSMWPKFKPFTARELVKAISANESLRLMFSSGSDIKAIQIEENGLSESTAVKLDTNDENDKVKSTASTTNYWYDNYFLTYGWQRIKNTEKDKKKRDVYFVNKIAF